MHKMHGRVIMSCDGSVGSWPLFITGLLMMTHPLPIAGKLPIKTMVARQLPTNTHLHTCMYIRTFITYGHSADLHVLQALLSLFNTSTPQWASESALSWHMNLHCHDIIIMDTEITFRRMGGDYMYIACGSVLKLQTWGEVGVYTVPSQKRAHYGISAHPPLLAQFPAKV